jgi:RNA polymerase sigma factor (TIGR02999 family)
MTEETPTKLPCMASKAAGVNDLFAALYGDLHAMAHKQLQRAQGPLLDTTALVHEAYLRFADSEQVPVADRRHFLAYAAHVMRSVVVDIIRSQSAHKRGSGEAPVTLNTDVRDAVPATEEEVLNIHEALLELSAIDTVLVQIVEMRYFAGLSAEEIAGATQLSERTVRRHWQKARIFLRESLTQD